MIIQEQNQLIISPIVLTLADAFGTTCQTQELQE